MLVTLDTLRHDAFDAGMPRTRAFASRGQVFERFFAASSTTQPSHASLFTGLPPWRHGVVRNGMVLADRFETLAERLLRQKFATAAVVASFPLEERFGFAQGFETYRHDFDRGIGLSRWLGSDVEAQRFYSLSGRVTHQALGMLDVARAHRQFFWFHYFDPHDPYGDTTPRPVYLHRLQAQAAERRPNLEKRVDLARRLYDRDVAELDSALGTLFDRLLEEADVYETHVIVASDHGESFGEQGSLGHGRRVSREELQVPFFMVSPRLAPGTRLDVAGSVDLVATILALIGADSREVPGRDLSLPPEGPGVAVGMRNAYAGRLEDHRTDGRVVVLDGPRFFVVRDGELYSGDRMHVFRDDRPELELDDALAGPLRRLFASFADALDGSRTGELLDEETQEALRALGYAR